VPILLPLSSAVFCAGIIGACCVHANGAKAHELSCSSGTNHPLSHSCVVQNSKQPLLNLFLGVICFDKMKNKIADSWSDAQF